MNLEVAVLGGGVAGIAAAVELASSGYRPVLIESRPYLGGRVRSFVHEGSGDEIDNGQHLMMGCYHATFRLLGMLGTRSLVALQPTLSVAFRDRDGTADMLTASAHLPSPLDVLAGMLRLKRLGLQDRLGLLRIAVAARGGKTSDTETVREFLTRHGQSKQVQDRLWDPLAIATLNTAPEIASAELFVELLRRAFLVGGDDSKLAYPRTGLSRLFEPAIAVIERAGGRVLLRSSIAGIEKVDNGFVVHLREQDSIRCHGLISALPSHALNNVASQAIRATLPRSTDTSNPRFGSSPIVSLYLWYDRPLEKIPPLCALIGTEVQWVFNRRLLAPSADSRYPGLLSCTTSAALNEVHQASETLVAAADSELRGAFPELNGARLLDSLVVKEKQATFLATPTFESIRPGVRTSVSGLFLAGDWTDTGLPATIEGAVQSGFVAAEQLKAQVSAQ